MIRSSGGRHGPGLGPVVLGCKLVNFSQHLAYSVGTSPCITLGLISVLGLRSRSTCPSGLRFRRQRGWFHKNQQGGLEELTIHISKSVATHWYMIWGRSKSFPISRASSFCKAKMALWGMIRWMRQDSGLSQNYHKKVKTFIIVIVIDDHDQCWSWTEKSNLPHLLKKYTKTY